MKKNLINVAVLVAVMAFTGCVSSSGPKGNISAINRVAVVSFSVSDYGGSVRAGSIGSTPVADLIDGVYARLRRLNPDIVGELFNLGTGTNHSVMDIVNLIGPEAIIVGGGVVESSDLFLPKIKKTMREYISNARSGYGAGHC